MIWAHTQRARGSTMLRSGARRGTPTTSATHLAVLRVGGGRAAERLRNLVGHRAGAPCRVLCASPPVRCPACAPSRPCAVPRITALSSAATGQIGFLNVAIGESPVTYAVPAYQSALLLGTLVLAGAMLDEFDSLPAHSQVRLGHAGILRAPSASVTISALPRRPCAATARK